LSEPESTHKSNLTSEPAVAPTSVQNAEPKSKVDRLIELGYEREDIQILPDGSVTIVQADEFKGTAGVVARATAPARLEKMLMQKKILDERYKLHTARPVAMTTEQIREYANLRRSIEATRDLIASSSKKVP
jgi:hypothetical protein